MTLSPAGLFRVFLTVFLVSFLNPEKATAGQAFHSKAVTVAAGLKPLGPLEEATHLNLTLSLPLRDKPALTNLLVQLYDPASPRFHQYLNPADFALRFAPSEQDYQSLIDFAKAHGLAVRATHPNRTLLEVQASPSAIEDAFHVHLRRYQHPSEARAFYAPDRNPSVDAKVRMLGIRGLDNYSLPRPNLHYLPLNQAPANRPHSGSGAGGLYMGSDFRAAYLPGVTLTGSHQSVALAEFDGYTPTDILQYESNASLPSITLSNILLDTFSGTPQSEQGQIEVSLDIEMAAAIAPGLSSILVYEGEIGDDILNRMATDDLANQLSSSWSWEPMDETTEQIFQQFAAQGQSMFEAAGDSGAYTGAIPPPSDDPNITVVGGTTLTTAGPNGPWISETVWNWYASGLGLAAGGGGISTVYPIPSWQRNVNFSKNQGSPAMRNIPDVALTADNVLVIADGQSWYVGGTSCATPLWAGLTALVNEQQAANNRTPAGFLNPAIYALGGSSQYGLAFHDITTGNNTSPASPSAFYAVPGYDLCTGWGTPSGSNTIAALVMPPDPLLISPPAALAIQGAPGGPFLPQTQSLTLTNAGDIAVNWTLSSAAPWLNASASGGILFSHGPSQTVTVSPNAAASNLAVGTYTATVWVTNLNDHVGQSRQFVLRILPPEPPLITQQPQNQTALAGAAGVFTVTAQGNPLFYQWQQNGTNLSDGGNISGAATATLTVASANAADAGVYSVIVSNAAAIAVSTGATLETYTLAAGETNLVQNGDFETGSFSGWKETGYYYSSSVSTNAPYVHSGIYGASLGNHSTSLGFLYQSISTTPDSSYLISLWLHSPDGATPNQFEVLWNGQTLFDATNLSAGSWTNLQFAVASDSETALLQLGFADESSDLGLDDVSVSNMVITATPPIILDEPVNQTANNGGAAAFAVVPASPGPLTYQWQRNGANLNNGPGIAGATSATLTLNNLTSASAGTYSVLVSNYFGTIASSSATLTVLATTQILDIITFDDLPDTATPLTVPVGYKGLVWSNFLELDGVNYSLPSGYAPATVSPSNVAVNATGKTASVSSATPFTMLSAYVTAVWNDNQQLEVVAYNGSQVVYNNTYTLSATQPTLIDFNYTGVTKVNFTTSGGTSHLNYTQYSTEQFAMDNLTLVIPSAPQILSPPVGQNVQLGADATLSVAANGATPLSYQWLRNGTPLLDGENLSGSGTATLTLAGVALTNAGIYSVLVSNAFGSDTSPGANLVVYASQTDATNIVQNGGFETGTFTNWSLSGVVTSDNVASYAPWIHSGNYGASVSAGNNELGYLSQTMPTTPGASYLVSFWLENPNGQIPNQFLVDWDGKPVLVQSNFDSSVWTNVQLFVTAAGSNDILQFGYSFPSLSSFFGLDDVSMTNAVIQAAPPVITSQPASQLAGPGDSVKFTVTATATPPPTYQWQFQGQNLADIAGVSGTTTPVLTIAAAATNAGTYAVIVSNAYGSVSSAAAVLSWPPPGQLFNLVTFDDLDESTTGMAVSNGYAGLGWENFDELDGENYPGPSGYNAAVISPGNVVYNDSASAAGITNAGPFDLVSAYLTSVWRDGLKVEVAGSAGGVTLYDHTYILSATAPSLIQFNYAAVDSVVFTSSGGTVHPGYSGTNAEFAMDNVALLLAISPPQIISQPPNQVVGSGSNVSFAVTVSGSQPLHYQWQKNGETLSDAGIVTGSATATLNLAAVSVADGGVYTVTVTNSAGEASSSGAALTIYSPVSGTASVVQNGGFETGDFNGWTLSGSINGVFVSTNPAYAHSGKYGAQLGPGSPPGGSLTQDLPTLPGSSYLLSLWLDSPDGLTPNEFLVSWNGSVLYNQSNLGQLGWTHLQYLVQSTSANTVLQFEFLDAPSYLGLDDITVQPVDFAPSIIAQPVSQTVANGQTVNLAVQAAGSGPLAYRWLHNGAALSDGGGISGSDSASLTVSHATAAQSGDYSVIVNNAFGSAVSESVLVAVYASVPGATNLVLNGGFETGNFTNWTLAGNTTGAYVATSPAFAHSGIDGAQLGGNSNRFGYGGTLSQNLLTVAGDSYLVSLWLENSAGVLPNYFLVKWNGAALFSQADLPDQNWENLNFVVTAASSNTVLQIQYEDAFGYLGLDDVSVSNITVNGAPALTVQPALQTVAPGAPAAFSVTAAGSAPLSYRWQFNGTNLEDGTGISGSTTSNLTLTGVSAINAGNYAVIVTNSFGSASSSAVPLTVMPQGATLMTFDELTNSTAGADIPTGYQGLTWSNLYALDGVDFSLPSGFYAGVVTPDNIVYNGSGSPGAMVGGTFNLYSAWLTAAWNENLEIEAIGYQNGVAVYDNTCTLSVTNPTLVSFNYQQVNEVLFIPSGGTPHLPFSQSSATEFVMDNMVVNPSAGAPQITTQPAGQALPAGGVATFNVQVSGSAPLTYQWSINGTNLSNGGPIDGATSSILTIKNVSTNNVGLYSVVVSNSSGSAASSNAPLTLLPSSADLITFDDLSDTEASAPIPDGYHGLTWYNFAELDGVHFGQPSGYSAGVISPPIVAFNVDGFNATLLSDEPFSLLSAYLTAAWNDNLEVEVTAYSGNTLACDTTYILSATQPMLIDFNCIGVTEINFITGGGTPHLAYGNSPGYEFAMDNMVIVPPRNPPQISNQPTGQVVPAGTATALTVAATGTPPLSYQWRRNGLPLTDGGNLSGSTTALLTFGAIAASNAGTYSVTVTNPYGLAVSTSAVINVYSPVAGAANLVQNGGFETGDFAGWTLSGDTTDNFVTAYPEYVHSGRDGAALGPPTLLGCELSQTLPTTPGQAYLLSAWLSNPDGALPNAFQISWNGSAIFNPENMAALVWTNLQFIVVAASTNSLLLFDAQNESGAFGLDDVTVSNIVVASLQTMPRISAVSSTPGGQFSFSWSAQPSQAYQVQYTPSLDNPEWINLDSAITATGPSLSASDNAAVRQRFYRVLLLP